MLRTERVTPERSWGLSASSLCSSPPRAWCLPPRECSRGLALLGSTMNTDSGFSWLLLALWSQISRLSE